MNNLKATPEILTNYFFKEMTSPALARHLKEHIWQDLEAGSTQSDLIEEAIKRLRKYAICITEQDYLENLDWAAKSYQQAMIEGVVKCRGCEKKLPLLRLFRCFHCGSYFCPNCARDHFGEREGPLHNAVMLANRNIEEVS